MHTYTFCYTFKLPNQDAAVPPSESNMRQHMHCYAKQHHLCIHQLVGHYVRCAVYHNRIVLPPHNVIRYNIYGRTIHTILDLRTSTL